MQAGSSFVALVGVEEFWDPARMKNTLTIAAALLLNASGQTLLVRKRGTQAFMQPGGKIDAGERPIEALARELHEELGLRIDPADALALGAFSAPAANEPGYQVHCQLFQLVITEDVTCAAEIEEARWVSLEDCARLPLAPLTRDHILPLYAQFIQTA